MTNSNFTNSNFVPSNYNNEESLKINSHSHSHSKVIKTPKSRTYVTLACTNCRSKKEKCSGGKPCENCSKRDRPCVYEKSDKKRGPKPKSAITPIITPKLFNLLNHEPAVSCL
ncbi:18152_t:CDS:1 [Dentiscutata erythropus]|uniref:18152_t:CDS:1 n=1 Tax=Dentiscutata erythropus TaxID=1348616 RepID=A0A9N8ZH12_9GLOM|nr:18152_t:CDS:1 [Dentiscutata erythropus]